MTSCPTQSRPSRRPRAPPGATANSASPAPTSWPRSPKATRLADAGADTGNVFFHDHPTNDAWCRDHGPIFVQRRAAGKTEEAILDWGYNAWGGKYPPYDLDDVIPTRIGREYGIPVHHPGIVLEGGSIDVNGRGSLLTTEACLLNPNRNPQLDRQAIEDFERSRAVVPASAPAPRRRRSADGVREYF